MDTYEDILARMSDKFQSLAGYSPDDASDIGIRLRILAGEIYSLACAVEWLKTQTFAQTAQGGQLDLRAQERGITRKAPTAAVGALTFARSAPLWCNAVIPTGTVCSTAGDSPARYVTTQDATLLQGQLSVSAPARAEQPGKAGNTQPGTVTVMVTPPAAAESVTNPAAFCGGEDSESDSELRGRLIQSYFGISNGSNSAFYREFALKYDGVYSVGVIPRENGAGTVGVYLGGKGCAPSDEIVQRVQKDLSLVREVNVDVHVAAAQTVAVDLVISVVPSGRVPDAEAVAAARQSVTDYFGTLAVGEPVVLAALGVAMMAGGAIQNYSFSGSVTTDKKVNANQLAVCGNLNVAAVAEG